MCAGERAVGNKYRETESDMQHFFHDIHGWFSAANLYRKMVVDAEDGAVFVEIGAWKGRSAAFMGVEIVNSGKDIKLHVVDWFKGSDEPAHHEDDDVRAGRLYEVFTTNIQPVAHVIEVHPTTSIEAASRFADNSLDFVFIDADHTYAGVKSDILAWMPKVKPGKILAGDDFGYFPGVNQAIDELLPGYTVTEHPTWVWRKPL